MGEHNGHEANGKALQLHASGVPTPALTADIVEKALMVGDFSKMDAQTRVAYYLAICQSAGLNPMTRPFIPMKTQSGEVVLYATRECAEQLRAKHRVSLRIVSREKFDGLYCVTVEGKLPDGRTEEAQGIVEITNLKGQALGNALMKSECVPLDTEILTRDGWKTQDNVIIGEEVLAYDCAADSCAWTPLQNVTAYPEAVTVRFGTELHSFRCTPDHSWAIDNGGYKPRVEEISKRRGAYKNRRPSRMLIRANEVKTSQRVILSAQAEGGDSPLTPAEAAILGWVMTDGTIKRRKSHVRLGICQSKKEHFDEIETALTGTGYVVSKVIGRASTRDFGTHVSECLPQTWWYLSSYDSRELMVKAGIETPADLPRVVTRLSREARSAMFAAMMAADGDKKGRFGKKRKPGVMEAWQILATLEGFALGKWHEGSIIPTQTARKQRYIAGSNITISDPIVEAVWCPTTAYGTWVMRQGHQITITGNSKAKRRVTLALCGLGFDLANDGYHALDVAFDLQTGEIRDSTAMVAEEERRGTEQGKSLATHIADLTGDGGILPIEAQITEFILANGGTESSVKTWWARQRAKHADLSPGYLSYLFDQLQGEVQRRKETQSPSVVSGQQSDASEEAAAGDDEDEGPLLFNEEASAALDRELSGETF